MSSHADPLADRLAGESSWRVLALAGGIVLATLLAVVLVVATATVTAAGSPLSGPLHQAAVGLPAVLAFYEVLRRVGLRASPSWFLAGRPDRRVLGWLAVGIAFPASVLGLQLWLLGAGLANRPPALETAVSYGLASLATGLLAGVLEELPLRGVLLRVLEARWSATRAVVTTAAVFAVLHQGHASGPVGLPLVLSSMFAAGLLLGVVVVRTRSVWSAVALHAGWNAVFGGQVVTAAAPGAVLAPAVLQFRLQESSTLLTGGPATLGAAPATTALLLAAAVVAAKWPHRWLSPGGGPG